MSIKKQFLPSIQSRILFVTPEITFIPSVSGKYSDYRNSRPERFADFPTDLILGLLELSVDVHVAQPDYRRIFADISQSNPCMDDKEMPCDRVHLTEDRVFFYSNCPKSNYKWENIRISLAFHREVINYILPLVQPDLIHCHSWMTGLIPAMARNSGIPCIFTVQSHDSAQSPLSDIEDMGIDAAAFWQHLYFERFPGNYEETRETNPIDFLSSGIFAADYVNVFDHAFSAGFGKAQNYHSKLLGQIIINKLRSGSANVQSNSSVDTQQYIDLYKKMLDRPLIETKRDDYQFYADGNHRSQRSSYAYQDKRVMPDNVNPILVSG